MSQEVDLEKWETSYLSIRRDLAKRTRRINVFEIDEDDMILDYGCADGLDMVALRDAGYKNIYGLDISFSLLTKMEDGFKIALGDGHVMPLPSHSFDIVFVNCVLHHLEPEMAVREIRRILRPGGQLCVIEPASSIVRRFLDWISFSSLYKITHLIPYIHYRRQGLEEEIETYTAWLKFDKDFVPLLKRSGFQVTFHRRTGLNLYVKAILSDSEEKEAPQ